MMNAIGLEGANARDQSTELAAQQRELRRRTDPLAENEFWVQDDKEDLDLREYWHILLRRKWTIIVAAAIALVAGLVVTYNTTPIYRSSLSLHIEPPNLQLTGFESESAFGASYLYMQNFQKTQVDVLKSHALARRVIDQLGLELAPRQTNENAPSYLAELKRSIASWFTDVEGSSDGYADVVKQAADRPNLEATLLGNLSVRSSPDSQVVRLSYDSPNPKEAASIANAIAENFISMNLERRYDATSYAEQFLEERIKQVRANLEDSERHLIEYAREREIVDLDDKLSTLMQTLNALNQELAEAEVDRIEAQSRYAQSLEGTGPVTLLIMDSPVIQALRKRKGQLETEYQGQPKVFKPDYPIMQQLRSQIKEIDQQIEAEVAAIREAVKADLEAKVQEQSTLQARVRELKSEILALHDRSTDYQTLKREVDTNRELYDGLLQRMKEVGVVAGITINNISILDAAQVPKAAYKPNLRKNMMVSLAIGLVGGILLAFLLDRLDDTVKSNEDVEGRVGAPVLGIIPFIASKASNLGDQRVALTAVADPRSPAAEAARSLRTSLSFATADGAPKIMHITSASAEEGKTMVAMSIAIAFAQTGGKVLLVDADLRAPSLHHVLKLPNTLGLTNYLSGSTKPAFIAQPTEVARLFAITSGPLPPNPVELLASARMLDLLALVSERFDYVVIDGPPLMGLADSVVLSRLAEGTIFVVDAERTRYGALEGSVKRLRAANSCIIGAVIDRFGRTGGRYGYGYNYDYHYTYDYGTRGPSATLPQKA